MDFIVALIVFAIGFSLGFVAGFKNADSKKIRAAVAAAKIVKEAIKKD